MNGRPGMPGRMPFIGGGIGAGWLIAAALFGAGRSNVSVNGFCGAAKAAEERQSETAMNNVRMERPSKIWAGTVPSARKIRNGAGSMVSQRPMPPARKKSVQPFRFTALERVTRRQVAILRALGEVVPAGCLDAPFLATFGATLAKYASTGIGVFLDSLHAYPGEVLRKSFGAPALIAELQIAPHPDHPLLEIDVAFAAQIADRLLGGSGEAPDTQRPLTEVERGVVSFVLAKLLGVVAREWSVEQRIAPRLMRLHAFAAVPPKPPFALSDSYVVADFKLTAELSVGIVRICIPETMVRHAQTSRRRDFRAHPPAPRELATIRGHFSRIANLEVECNASVGSASLTLGELRRLDASDVLLLEHCTAAPSGAGIDGDAQLVCGTGEGGGFRCEIERAGSRRSLRITAFEPRALPVPKPPRESPEPDMTPEEKSHQTEVKEADNLEELARLLPDLPVAIAVEIGRVQLTAEKVLSLRPGQILEPEEVGDVG